MKRLILCFFYFVIIRLGAYAQSTVHYSYDTAGNRTGRSWSSSSNSSGQESEILLPVIVPGYIDTLAQKEVKKNVSLDPENIPLVLSEDEKTCLNEELFRLQREEEISWWQSHEWELGANRLQTDYSVGAIPLQDAISASGARIYSLPIPTAAGFKLVPNISLTYNSQAAEGWAGYNWDIQGISCIKLINRNDYYHNSPKAADVNASDPVFALDGIPLVTNAHSETSSVYPLECARGHILAAPEFNSNNKICRFTVLYPNGIRAVYGRQHSYNYNLVFYKIAEMADLEGNKITFTYTTDENAGNDCLTAIRYGYDNSGNYSGEITFSYTSWTDTPRRYFAGKVIRYNKRLNSIESRTDGEVLSAYDLTYEQQASLWLLNRIECTSGSASLPPVVFTYTAVPSSQNLKKDNRSITLSSSFFIQGVDNVYKRGKFLKNEYRDGILIYPGLSPYTFVSGGYGSEFNSEQKIIFIPRLERSNTVNSTSLKCGYGFQTIDAVDIDGDGIDEIVRVNMTGWQGEYSKYAITVFRCNDSGTPVQECSFVVLLHGVAGTVQPSPYHRTFRWGDFNGDGKAELLAVAYSSNYPGTYYQSCYTAVIDIESQSVLSDEVLFSGYTYNGRNCLIAQDIDNDGRTELCYAETDGFKIYRLQNNGHFSLENTLSNPTSTVLSNPNRPSYMADINGDGYLDLAQTPSISTSSSWTVYYYNGTSFSSRTVSIAQPSSFTSAMFMDVNRDGMADMVTIKETSGTTATLGTYISQNGYSFGSYQLSPSDITDAKGIVPVNLSAYKKPSSFMKFDGLTVYNYSYIGITAASRHITTVEDSFGKIHTSGYAYLPTYAPAWSDASITVNNSQGYLLKTLPIYVLSTANDYLSPTSSSYYNLMEYEYYNGVVHNRGLGFCGFSRIRAKEMFNLTQSYVLDVTDTYYDPEKMGVVNKVERRQDMSGYSPVYLSVTNTWDSYYTTYGKLNPRLSSTVVVNATTGINTNTSFSYDYFELPTESRTFRSLGGGNSTYERHSWTYQHSNTPSKYVLGSIVGESRWQDIDGDYTHKWKQKTITTLDTLYRPISRKSFSGVSLGPATNPHFESVDSTLLVRETRWTYDSYGNVTSEKSAPYDATDFIGHTYTYDSNGRYMLTDTDALGHTTSYVNYNLYGKPGRIDDYRDRSTYYSYDPWGRVISVNHNDGSVENTSYEWGGEGLYTVAKTQANGGPSSVHHYDALDREIRSGEKRFYGQWQYKDKQYNRYGEVTKVSVPFRGNAPSYWNTYTYDGYHRLTKIAEPSGRETKWSYNGTSTTTTKDGVVSISTKDASGNVVSAQDACGTIIYTLRDDGQISRVTAPGDVVTTFTYDSYGRRTKIVDPSAGTRTESYVWNADGSHQQTHSGPNGSITTSWDKYGRTTTITRPGEFNTTFTYDNYGLLSSEQSGNGTGADYTYDSYDRISTVKETVPEGKWLKKTYSYGSWGNVSSIKYSTQDGDITTETYSYVNGQNCGVYITDGTTVWNLISENDFGTPTEITTGSITREYGFTDFGLPLYRKMAGGSLQHFTYQLNPNNGNLSSRTDAINNTTESFNYDILNRLDTLGIRIAHYANNGNLLSIDGVGSMSYGNAGKPYQVTSFAPSIQTLVPGRTQEISYNSLDRPSFLEEGDKTASFTYNATGDRVKMHINNGVTQELTRYYIGDRYECDSTSTGTTERLYLGGDAYTAPMVLQKINNGSWTPYNIGRDYLGNITHIATASGSLVAEYSYDPWGRLRSPVTHFIYSPGNEPDLFLGRGFTGHEHLSWFSLINMNARLYDPLLGRFLSPDPYVQAPDFTQNFNRYSYALNNPLKYTDPSGEFVISTAISVGVAIGYFCGSIIGSYIGFQRGATGIDMVGYSLGGGLVGGLAGLAGGITGSALASIGSSGFLGGAIAGGTSTAASCFISGTGFSLLNGNSFSDALINGVISGGIGFAAGGIIGGLSSGISSTIHGGNFWTGKGAIEEYAINYSLGDRTIRIGDDMEYSNAYAQSFSDRNYGFRKRVNQLIADGRIPQNKGYYYDGDYVLNRKGEVVMGLTEHGGLGKGSDVYLFKAAFTSKEQLYLTMGHEYLHIAFYHPGVVMSQQYYDSHAVIYDWSLKQALAWANYGVDIQHYSNMFNDFSLWLPFNPYSYQSAGFSIIYHLPL